MGKCSSAKLYFPQKKVLQLFARYFISISINRVTVWVYDNVSCVSIWTISIIFCFHVTSLVFNYYNYNLFFNTTALETEVNLNQAVLGAILGYLSLWSVNSIFRMIRGKEGLGQGDFKLLASIGAWLGWQCLAATIILSSLMGAIVGIYMVTTLGKNKNHPIPFGPYLSAAAFIFIIWGPQINNFYLANI